MLVEQQNGHLVMMQWRVLIDVEIINILDCKVGVDVIVEINQKQEHNVMMQEGRGGDGGRGIGLGVLEIVIKAMFIDHHQIEEEELGIGILGMVVIEQKYIKHQKVKLRMEIKAGDIVVVKIKCVIRVAALLD